MEIKGYVALHIHDPYERLITVYRIFTLERRSGDLCWVSYNTGLRKKPEGLIHITSFHGDYERGLWKNFCDQLSPFDSIYTVKFEPHHIERIWCRDDT